MPWIDMKWRNESHTKRKKIVGGQTVEAGEKGKFHLGLKHKETLCHFCDSD